MGRKGKKEGKVLFNDALNTFYLYSVIHVVNHHTDCERRKPLPWLLHGLLFLIISKGYFYMHYHTDRIAHTTAFVTPVVEHRLEREIAQWVHHMKDRVKGPFRLREKKAAAANMGYYF